MSRRAKVFVDSITSAGLPVGNGDIKTLDFPAGGITESSPGVASINVVGSTGAPGSNGSNGSNGNDGNDGNDGAVGPAGPGFTSFQSGYSIPQDIVAGVITVNFGIGFNWRMAAAGCAQTTEAGGTDGISVRFVNGVGTSTVSVQMFGVDANANAIFFSAWYQASG